MNNKPKYIRTNIYLEPYQSWVLFSKDRKKVTGQSGAYIVRKAIDYYFNKGLSLNLNTVKKEFQERNNNE